MGTIAIQTQCCLQEKDDWESDEEEGAPEEKASSWKCLGIGALAAALLARLVAHRPRCPGVSRRRPSSPASPVQMQVNVTMRV